MGRELRSWNQRVMVSWVTGLEAAPAAFARDSIIRIDLMASQEAPRGVQVAHVEGCTLTK